MNVYLWQHAKIQFLIRNQPLDSE